MPRKPNPQDLSGQRLKEQAMKEYEAGQCSIGVNPVPSFSPSLLEQFKEERERVTSQFHHRIKELRGAEALLQESDAEAILDQVKDVLYGR